ncbi:cytochrome c biogenesis protein CcsA [Alteromonas sp. ASW11-36]|uniref:Cytochrome c biogenesis protein CcsA n=1 Tax=Alteromonas arenosi TaxID=3055817 RepID=A0ABT7SWN9_9ALTE|nr:cytochrome c biogenesis protein CcsA [Alteromonas sp. ASW11-36]MDM7859979.1 cytochrome c biogenesis protein CcsA [Alteromonas sp. ASW11-36]
MVDSATILFALLACALYIAASAVLMRRFFHREGPRDGINRLLAIGAIAGHAAALFLAINGGDNQNMTMANVLSLVAWLMTISMLISSLYFQNVILLPVVFGLSAVAILLSVFVPDAYAINIALKPGLVIHITLSLFAYGTLIIALLYALQVNYIGGKLKQKDSTILHSSLPPLMMLDRILIKLLYVGTGLLFIAIVSGGVFLDDMLDKQHIHKTVLSVIALAVYATALIGNAIWGWRGRTLMMLVSVSSVVLTLAYFGSRFVREVLL